MGLSTCDPHYVQVRMNRQPDSAVAVSCACEAEEASNAKGFRLGQGDGTLLAYLGCSQPITSTGTNIDFYYSRPGTSQ